ncbi:MAG: SAM-dependent chlorinase/fluorinase [Anaerolineae bacterium]|nr:SAM-dependent chlorinase/fluorinase [Anaerolineae bacterium]
MTIIRKTTDFGIPEGVIAMMKGIIYDIVPNVKIVEISQMVSPQNVREGAIYNWQGNALLPIRAPYMSVLSESGVWD